MIIGIIILIIFVFGILKLRQTASKYGGPIVNTYMNVMDMVHWVKLIGVIILLLIIFIVFPHTNK